MDNVCVVCLHDLGVKPGRRGDGVWRPPSTKLEVGGKNNLTGQRPWRLSTFEEKPASKRSSSFNSEDVWRIYHLCGDGHIWLAERLPDSNMAGRSVGNGRVVAKNDISRLDGKVTLAMVGEVAAGKSYLLARTLAQSLFVSPWWKISGADTALAYERLWSDAWEDKAGQDLNSAYDRTLMLNLAMAATERHTLLPVRLLSAAGLSDDLEFENDDDLIKVLQWIHKQLPGAGAIEYPNFGAGIRQPVVVRAKFSCRDGTKGGKEEWTTWTGVADLAGESFTPKADERETQEARLQGFDGLIWVIDPAVDHAVDTAVKQALADEPRYGEHGAERVLAASTRPDGPAAVANSPRSSAVAKSIAASRGMRRTDGSSQPICIVISKCDLIRKALRVDGFEGLGERVAEGVRHFIGYVVERSRPRRDLNDGVILPSPALAAVLRDLHAEADSMILDRKIEAMATGLLDHFGNPVLFWRLVHGHQSPGADAMTVPLPGLDGLPSANLEVPSLRQHMVDSLQPGKAGHLQVRDFVMSALGCGVSHGLGFSDAIDRLMETTECDLRFFLCSPLVNSPIQPQERGVGRQIVAAEGGRFPDLDEQSAGLTHLLLAMMRVGLK